MNQRNIHKTPPEKFQDLRFDEQKTKSVGIPSIKSALEHIYEEMGIMKGVKLLKKMNQHGGFDCPGCAWPDPDEQRSKLGEFCENGVKAIAEEATDKLIGESFFAEHSVEEISEWSDYEIGKSGRIIEPLFLPKDSSHYQPISWEEAFSKIGSKLKSLSSPDQAAFYTSGRTSNEAAFMYQLMVRQYGTNNLPDCSNMCHESSGTGLSHTLGIGKGSVTLEDLHESELIVVIGQNPGTNHPRMLTALEKCKKNGGKIVTINPIQEAGTTNFINPQNPVKILSGGTQLEDLYLQVKINGDVALLKTAMALMLKKEKQSPGSVFDHEFINEFCSGYDSLIEHLESIDLQKAIIASGVSEKEIEHFVELIINNEKIIFCWAMGLTQHENGVANIQEIVNILLLRGSIGKPGAGTCPVRGHSNVQGDRTMGIWEKPKTEFLKKLEERFGFIPPEKHGYDTVECIKAMNEEKVKVFVGLGGNFISATPDSNFTAESMMKCDLTVQVSTKLNRAHLVTGEEALILPCISRSEIDEQEGEIQFISTENSMGVVQMSKGILTPCSANLKSEPAIIAGIANSTLDNTINWTGMVSDYDEIRNHIEAVIPGFENYNSRVRKKGGFYLPNGARERNFNTKTGKANFTVNNLPKNSVSNDRYILMTIRTHDQFNTTIYGMNDRYRGIYNERRVVLMNSDDMKEAGFQQKEVIDIVSRYDDRERIARNFKIVPYNIAKGCLASYFPETNVLVSINEVAKGSNTPVSKFIKVELRRTEQTNF